jgi:hypothetical protein
MRPRTLWGVDAWMVIVRAHLGKGVESITARNTDTAATSAIIGESYDFGVAGFPGNGEALRAVRGPSQRN